MGREGKTNASILTDLLQTRPDLLTGPPQSTNNLSHALQELFAVIVTNLPDLFGGLLPLSDQLRMKLSIESSLDAAGHGGC